MQSEWNFDRIKINKKLENSFYRNLSNFIRYSIHMFVTRDGKTSEIQSEIT